MTKVSENLVTNTIDYLSYTVSWEQVNADHWRTLDAQELSVSRLTKTNGGWKRDIPLHGYEDAWVNADVGFARVMVSRPGHAMGIHVQLPGQALACMGAVSSLARAMELKASVTRIDIAVDVRGISEAKQVFVEFHKHTCKTRAQKCILIDDGNGATSAVGSRESERYLRVYDKAAEQGVEGNWTRIELECKARVAKWVAFELSERGFDGIGAMIKKFIECPTLPWYQDALSRANVEIGAPQPKKMTDTRAWLLGVVAKTLARETAEDAVFLKEFLTTVQALRAGQ